MPHKEQSFSEIFDKAFKSGFSGSMAMLIQVCTLMWLRTTMNYQYRYGGTIKQTLQTLYSEGGIRRFYRGIGPALIQGPVSRFGDTFGNTGFLALCESNPTLNALPIGIKVAGGSLSSATFRLLLIPVDTCKTILQVEGKEGLKILMQKVNKGGPKVLYHGALATFSATAVGHYPWFATFNILNEYIPQQDEVFKKLGRRAFIGFTSSVVSDTISNSLRVLKTTKQTSSTVISYKEALAQVIEKDGYVGLFGRGLKTRILTNGLQGLLFSVLWKGFEDLLNKKSKN